MKYVCIVALILILFSAASLSLSSSAADMLPYAFAQTTNDPPVYDPPIVIPDLIRVDDGVQAFNLNEHFTDTDGHFATTFSLEVTKDGELLTEEFTFFWERATIRVTSETVFLTERFIRDEDGLAIGRNDYLIINPISDDLGTFDITITAHDLSVQGSGISTEVPVSFTFTTKNANAELTGQTVQRYDSISEGESVFFPSSRIGLSDADGPVTCEKISGPESAVVETDCAVRYTALEIDGGTDVSITMRATGTNPSGEPEDGVDVKTVEIIIPVIEINVLPILNPIGSRTADEGTLVTFTATTIDPDMPNPLMYSLHDGSAGSVPDGARIHPTTGVFEWTPSETQPGQYTFDVRVTDREGATDSETITLTIVDTNAMPVLDSIGPITADETTLITFTAAATDVDIPTNQLTYSLRDGSAGRVPDGARIDPVSGVFEWTPSETQPGLYTFDVVVSDGVGGSDFETITLTVVDTNTPPVIAPIEPIFGVVDTQITFTVTATDTDIPENSLRYVLDPGEGEVPLNTSIGFTTGIFTWTPNQSQIGEHTFDIGVLDQRPGGFTSQTVTITVVEPQNAPVLVLPTIASSYPEGVRFQLDFGVTDADSGQSHTFALTGTDSDLVDSFDAATGILVWTPDELEDGRYSFTVTVTDDYVVPLSDSREFDLVIQEQNSPLRAVGISDIVFDELVPSLSVPIDFTVADPDVIEGVPDELTFSLGTTLSPPPGLTFDPDTNQIAWTPTERQDGSYIVFFDATDGEFSVSYGIGIRVNEVNVPPASDSIPAQTATQGAQFNLDVAQYFRDSDFIRGSADVISSYSLDSPPGWLSIDSGTGQISGTVTRDILTNTPSNPLTVAVVAADAAGAEGRESFELTLAPSDPPVLNPIGSKSGDASSLITFTATATGIIIPGNALTFSLGDGSEGQVPDGALIDPVTGVFTWTPAEIQAGTHTFDVIVSYRVGGSDSETITVAVASSVANTAPVLVVPDIASDYPEGQLLQLDFGVTDEDTGQTHTFELTGAGSELVDSFDQSTGVLAWTPAENEDGTYRFTVTVTDDHVVPLSDSREFDLVISEQNTLPVLNAIEAQTGNEGTAITFTAVATDVDLPPNRLEYSLASGSSGSVPEGATIGLTSGVFDWTPTESQSGQHTFDVVASDGTSSVFETVTVTVDEVNTAPVLNAIGPQTGTAGTAITFTASATDADIPANALEYSLSPGSSGSVPTGATIDPTTGAFAWTPDDSDIGPNTFDVVVSDGTVTVSQTVTVTVAARPNTAPVLVLPTIAPDYPELQRLELDFGVTDADSGQTHTFALTGTGSDLVGNFDAATGTLVWTPGEDQDGTYRFTVTVTDDHATDSQSDSHTFDLVISEVNTAPVLEQIGAITGTAGTAITFTATATDADIPANALEYSLAAGTSGSVPDGAAIDPTTGAFAWTPEDSDIGPNTFDVVVSDRITSVSQTVTVTVAARPNTAPVLVLPTIVPAYPELQRLELDFGVTDADSGQTHTFALTGTGSDLVGSFDAATGTLVWTPGEDQDGTYIFTVTVTDDHATAPQSASRTFNLVISEVNTPPVLDPIGAITGTAGTTITFTATATDADRPPNTLEYSLDDGTEGAIPLGATIDQASGAFTWTPQQSNIGVHTFDVIVSDRKGGFDSETVTGTVTARPNSAPVLAIPAIAPAYPEGQRLELDFGVTDTDSGQTHTFALTGTGSDLVNNFDTATGTLVWTPAEDQDGTYRFTVTVTDDHATAPQSASRTFDLVITEVNTAPVLDPIGPITGTVGTPITFTASAIDADRPSNTLVYSLADGSGGLVPPTAAIGETSGAFAWTPQQSDIASHTFDVTVSDGTVTVSRTVTVTVVATAAELNNAPVLIVPEIQSSYPELQRFKLDFGVTDADSGQTHTFALTGAGSNLVDTFDAVTGALVWMPGESEDGTYSFTVTVTDDHATNPRFASHTFNLVILEVNTAPVLGQIGAVTGNVGTPITFTASATDDDVPENSLVYSLADGTSGDVPAGAAIDETSGAFAWTPEESDIGAHTFDVIVSDATASDFETITVTVLGVIVGNNPTIYDSAINPITLNEGSSEFVNLPFHFIDSDTANLVYSFTVTKDSEIFDDSDVFRINGEVFIVNANFDSHGVYSVTVSAQERSNPPATGTFSVTINNVNRALVGSNVLGVSPINEGDVLTAFPPLEDPDGPITCVQTSGRPGTVANDCNIRFVAEESDGGSTQTITMTVTGTNDDGNPEPDVDIGDVSLRIQIIETNEPPVLDEIGPITSFVGTQVTFTAPATDADIPVNRLVYSLVGGSGGSVPPTATIDRTTGAFEWTPQQSDVGVNTFDVTVSDGTVTVSRTVTVTVVAAAEFNAAPVLVIPAIAPAYPELQLLELDFGVTDEDTGQTHTFELTGTGSDLVDSFDTDTGTLVWMPAENEDGAYSFTVTVTDDHATNSRSASRTFDLVISEQNTAPIASSPRIGLNVSELAPVPPGPNRVTDPDVIDGIPDDLTYSIVGGTPPAGLSIDPDTGAISWTPTERQNGDHQITIQATDGELSVTFVLSFRVLEVNNHPPLLNPIGSKSGREGTPITFTASASDADFPPNTLTYSLDDGAAGSVPTGARIDPITGIFTWTPGESQSGTYTFDVRVSDGTSFASETITVTVADIDADRPTIYTLIFALVLNEDDPRAEIDLDDHFTDDDTVSLAYSVSVTKDSVPFDDDEVIGIAGGKTFYVAPNFESHGSYSVTVAAQDGSNPPATGTFLVTIRNVNQAVIPYTGPAFALDEGELAGSSAVIIDNVSDPDGPITCQKTSGSESITVASDCTVTFVEGETLGGTTHDLVVRVTGTNHDGAPEAGVDIADVTLSFSISENQLSPVGTTIPAQDATQDIPFSLDVSGYFSDADIIDRDTPDALTYSLGGTPPAWLSIEGATGVLTGTLTQEILAGAPTSPVMIQVIATDTAGLTASESFALTLLNVNDPPILDAIGPQTGNVGEPITFTATATDADLPADTLRFSLDDGASGDVPAGAAIDPESGDFAWTPQQSDIGENTFDVVVSDGTVPASQTVTVTVAAAVAESNSAPVIIPPEIADSYAEGIRLTLDFDVTDADAGQSHTFELLTNATAVTSIDPATGVIAFHFYEKLDGTYSYTVQFTDDHPTDPLSASYDFDLVITEVNNPPFITFRSPSIGGNELTTINAALFEVFESDIVNGIGQELTVSLINDPPDGLTIVNPIVPYDKDGTDIEITWTPTEQQDGVHGVTFLVSDGMATASRTFTFTVREVNVPPTGTAIPSQTVTQDAPFALDASQHFDDSDVIAGSADVITYSLDSPPDWLTIDSGTGQLGGTATREIITNTPTNPFTVDVMAADLAGAVTTESFELSLVTLNEPPVLDPIGSRSGNVGTAITFTATATDTDVPADTLTFTLEDGAAGSVPQGAAIDPTSGAFEWTPQQSDIAEHTFDVVVSDGTLSDSETITVTVEAKPNIVPDLVVPTIADSYPELVELRLDFGVADADADQSHTFALTGTGSDLVDSFDITTGTLVWTPAENEDGTHSFTVSVTDDHDTDPRSDSHTFDLVITEQNTAPVLEQIGAMTGTAGTAITFTAAATDVDIPTNALRFTLDDGTSGSVPTGAAIDETSGAFEWTPEQSDAGENTFDVVVSDGTASVSETITITVYRPNTAPVIVPPTIEATYREFQIFELDFDVTDADAGQSHRFELLTNATGVTSIDPDTGVIGFRFYEKLDGTYSYTVQFTDDHPINPLSASHTFTLAIPEVNTPPDLGRGSNLRGAEFELIRGTLITARESDIVGGVGQELTVELVGNVPTGLELVTDTFPYIKNVAHSIDVTWTPTEEYDGTNEITVQVTDGVATVSRTGTITVREVNVDPTSTAIPLQTATQDVPFVLELSQHFDDSDIIDGTPEVLTYTLNNLPGWLTLDRDTGRLSGTATQEIIDNTPGNQITLTAVATDTFFAGNQARETFTLRLADTNIPPVLDPIGSLSGTVGTPITFTATASDDDIPADTLRFSLAAGTSGQVPDGAAIDETSGVFEWTPQRSDAGENTFDVVVSDGIASVPETITITVEHRPNTAPDLVVPTIAAAYPELVELQLDFGFTDADTDQIHTFALTGTDSDLVDSFDVTTGILVWTPAENEDGTYSFTVTVSDDHAVDAQSDSHTFDLVISEVNTAPVLEQIGARTGNVGTAITFTAAATDADLPANTLRFSLADGTSGSVPTGAAIDETSGVFEWTPQRSDAGENTFDVIVSDGTASDSETITITVISLNTAPVLVAPTIAASYPELVELQLDFGFTDADADQSHTFALTGTGSDLIDSFDTGTGVLVWMPSETQDGTHSFTVTVTDDHGTDPQSDSHTFDLVISEVNTAPVLEQIGAMTGTAGTAITFTAAATDDDVPANPLRFSLEDGTSGDVPDGAAIGPTTGVFEWTPQPSHIGENTFDVIVSDGTASASETVTITVVGSNTAPVLVAPTIASSYPELVELQLDFGFTDADTDQLHTFALTGTGSDLVGSFDTGTGVLVWTPGETQDGTYSFTVTVTDDHDTDSQSDSHTFDLVISEVNRPPVLELLDALNSREFEAWPGVVEIIVTATDPDIIDSTPDDLTFSLVGDIPEGMTINPNTGAISWTPNEDQDNEDNPYTITMQLSDGDLSVTDQITTRTLERNTSPVGEVIPTQTALLDVAFDLDASQFFSDPDIIAGVPDVITYTLDNPPAWLSIDPSTGVFAGTATQEIIDNTPSNQITVTVVATDTTNAETRRSFSLMFAAANAPPVLAPIGDQTVQERMTLTFTVTATDPDIPANTLTFSFDSADDDPVPRGITLDPTSGVFEWTPGERRGGTTTTINVRVFDGTVFDSETITITVEEVNSAPVLNAIPSQTGDAGTLITFTASATDADSGPANTLRFSLEDGTGGDVPDGAAIDETSGVFEWTPQQSDAGVHTFDVVVSDGTDSDSQTVTVTVAAAAEPNTAPVLVVPTIATSYPELVQFQLDFGVTDEDADQSHTFELTGTGSSLVDSFDEATGILVWTPAENEDGTHSFTVTVTDNHAADPQSDSRTFNLVIIEQNTAPILAQIGAITGTEGTAITFTATATDADVPANTLTFTLAAGTSGLVPDGAAINSSSGAFAWTPQQSDVGANTFDVVVSDGTASASQTVTVTVEARPNTAPDLTVPIIAATYPELVELRLDFDVTDADADQSHTFALTGTGSDLVDSFDINTGILVWTPAENEDGAYSFTVTVSDDHGTDPQSDSITFNLVIAEQNTAPVLEQIGARTGTAGTAITFTASATDADLPANTLTFTLEDGTGGDVPDGAAINSSTGVFEWTPQQSDIREHTFDVVVSDGTASDSQTVTLTVEARPNTAPVITAPTIASSYPELVELRLDFDVTDADAGQSHTFALTGTGSSLVDSFDEATGILVWTPAENEDDTYSFTVTVTDDHDTNSQSDSHAFDLVISEVNTAPVLEQIEAITGNVGTPITFTAAATDDDVPANTLRFSLEDGTSGDVPDDAAINSSSGVFEWTPEQSDVSEHTFDVVVSDGTVSDSQTVTVTVAAAVAEPNTAPVITVPTIADSYPELVELRLDFDVTDADSGQSHTFALTGTGSSLVDSFDEATGILVWTPAENEDGTHSFTVTVTDDHATNPQSDSHAFDLVISEVNTAPVLEQIEAITGNVGTPITFTATATDADVPANTLTFTLEDGTGGDVPDGAAINSSTGAFAWTPQQSDVAVHTFDVVVSDGTVSDSQTVTVTVESRPNTAPVITAPTIAAAYPELVELRLDFDVTDEDAGQSHTFALTGTGSGLVDGFDVNTGILVWTPAENEDGTHSFTVTVTDDHATNPQSDSHAFDLVITEQNTAPVLEQIGARTGAVGTAITFTATATDADVPANTLRFSLEDGTGGDVPDGAAINETTGAFAWTPQQSDVGANTFDVVVSDGTVSDSQTITVTVVGPNTAPVITAPTIAAAYPELVELRLDFDVTDADAGQSHTFALTGTGSNLVDSFDEATGILVWTPAENEDGTHSFTVTVTDDHVTDPQSDSHAFDLVITEQNTAPVLEQIGARTGAVGTAITFTATATDADVPANTLRFSLEDGTGGDVPDGAAINETTGAFAWTPQQSDVAVHTFDVVVSDGTSSVSETITVTVALTDDPTTYTPISPLTLDEDDPRTEIDLDDHFTDADTSSLAYSIAVTKDSEPFDDSAVIGIGNGETFYVDPNFESHGVYAVTITAQMGTNTPATGTVAVTINNVNRAVSQYAGSAITANEQESSRFNIAVIGVRDLDGPISCEKTSGPADITVTEACSINYAIGETLGGSSFDLVIRVTGTNDAGAPEAGVDIADVTIPFTISELNSAPVGTTIPSQTATQDTPFTLDTSQYFSDSDIFGSDAPDTLTYSLGGTPPTWLSIDGTTGVLSGTLTQEILNDAPSDQVTIQVTATDTTGRTASESFALTLVDTNDPPVLAGIGSKSGDEHAPITFTATATDADVPADTLTFSLDDGTSGSVPTGAAINPTTGAFEWTPDESQGGMDHTFDVRVFDETVHDSETITVTVSETNSPPVLDAIGQQTGDENTQITFTASVTDPDVPPNTLTFSLTDGASGSVPPTAAINPASGAFEWTPDESQGGTTHTFDVVVSDGTVSDSQTVTVTVNDTNDAPDLTVPTIASAYPEQAELRLDFGVTDSEIPEQSHTFALTGTGSNLVGSFDAATGVLVWTPAENEDGTHSFTVTVTDDYSGNQLSDSHTFDLVISEVNTTPDLTLTSVAAVDEEAVWDTALIGPTATDPDIIGGVADELTFSFVGNTPDGLTIDSSTGRMAWTPTEQQDGDHNITVRVTDGESPVTDTIAVTVNEIAQSPVGTTIPAQTALQDISFTLDASPFFSDDDVIAGNPDVITYSLDSPPDWLSINSGNGIFSGTATQDVINDTPGNEVQVTVVASDIAGAQAEEMFTLTLTDTNDEPVALSTLPTAHTVDEDTQNDTLDILSHYTDADPGSTLTLAIDNGRGFATADGDNLVFNPENDHVGTNEVTFTVQDVAGTPFNTGTVTVTVNNVNDAPTALVESLDSTFNEEFVIADDVEELFADVDVGDTLTITHDGPDFVTFPGNTVYSVIPTYDDAGEYAFTIVATDSGGATASIPVTYEVTNVNRAPVLHLPENLHLVPGTSYTFDLNELFEDLDGDDVEFRFTYDGEMVPQDAFVIDYPDITFTLPINADLSKTLVATIEDTDPESLTDTETVQYTYQPLIIPTIPEADRMMPDMESATDQASASLDDMPIPTVEIQPATSQTFEYSIAFYDEPAPSLARVYSPDVTDERLTTFNGNPIQFLNGVVDIDASATGRTLVTLTYEEPVGLDESALSIWHFEKGRWSQLSSQTLDTDANTVSGYTRSFSPFAIGTMLDEPRTDRSSDSIEHLKAPTFGTSKLNNNQVVECGYSMDGRCIDVLGYHEDYLREIIQTNSTHDFALKAFGQSPIRQFQIGFGVSGIGEPINNAEAVIRVAVTQDSKSAYSVEAVEIIDEHNTIDFEPQNAGVQKVACTGNDNNSDDDNDNNSNNSKTPQCVELTLNGVLFREQFHSEPFVIHVMDSSRRSSHNYMNEGLLVQGTSLNPAPTASKLGMPVGTSDLVSFELTRTDKLEDIWTDQFGHTWTRNSFGTWLQLTFPEVRHGDDAQSVKVMTRVHSDFADLVMEQQDRATLVFDAASIINGQMPETFSHDYYPGIDHDLSRLQKLADQLKAEQERAQKIIDAMMGKPPA